MQQDLKDKRFLIIGLGTTGRATARFLLNNQAHVIGVDANEALINQHAEIASLRENGLIAWRDLFAEIDLNLIDTVIVSPGVPPSNPLYTQAISKGIEVIGEIELACRYLKGTVLGITGTNGKTTVTSLVTHVLNYAGKSARALGNIGTPLISEVMNTKSESIAVVELSSYQLETIQTPCLDAGVVLNITPDHLDRYKDMNEYANAKWKIQNGLKQNSKLFVEERCYKEYGSTLRLKPILYGYTEQCELYSDLKHLFFNKKMECVLPSAYQNRVSHDLENLMAAYGLCRHLEINPEVFLEAIQSFQKPAHRISFVCNVKGIDFYDDSKGTNIDSVMRAVESFPGNIILIAGGVDKGAAYTPWIDGFKSKVKKICAIGQAAKKIKEDLNTAISVEIFDQLETAVRHAAQIAKPGDVILLSPGCSSFDMFRDYAHRGQEYQRIVRMINLEKS